MEIWKIGNTGVRNPMRIQDALRVYEASSLVGDIRGVGGSVAFMDLLCERGILRNEPGKDSSGSYGRKFRLVFNIHGLTYDVVRKQKSFSQSDLGSVDHITPFGRRFLEAETVPALQECFLRADSMPMEDMPGGKTFSPLRWVLAVLLEVERQTGTPDLSFIEFATCVQTSSPVDGLPNVVAKILDLRKRREASSAKKKFDTAFYCSMKGAYSKSIANFREYGDMNIRYLKATGIVRAKGHGVALVAEKRKLAEQLAATLVFDIPELDRLRTLYSCPPLPTDRLPVAMAVLDEMEARVRKRGISYSLDRGKLTTPADVNNARSMLEMLLSQSDEIIYAKRQKDDWREIADYIDLVMQNGGKKSYDEEREIFVPKEETSAYLEWCLWRAFLAMNTLRNKPYEVRRFKVDQDFFPVNTAPGGGPDLIAEYEDSVVVIEVTMSGGSRQEAMEGEPVRRHVADLVKKFRKPVWGLFIANVVDTNTVETFRSGVWYAKGDERMSLNIVPFSLRQFKEYFVAQFESGRHSNGEIVDLICRCGSSRELYDAPTWRRMIASDIDHEIMLKRREMIEVFDDIPSRLCFSEFLPLYSYRAACGKFGDGAAVEPQGWIRVGGLNGRNERLFVLRVQGRSMEPKIPDGAYCVFEAPEIAVEREDRVLLVQYRGAADPETGGAYTVKRFVSKSSDSGLGPEIELKPINNEFKAMRFTSKEALALKPIAEFKRVLL